MRETTLLGQVRGSSALIINLEYMNTIFFFLSLSSSRLHAPFFMGAFSLYSPILLHPSLPFVNLIRDLLDACLIQNLLEAL